jgi:hypothetical protein
MHLIERPLDVGPDFTAYFTFDKSGFSFYILGIQVPSNNPQGNPFGCDIRVNSVKATPKASELDSFQDAS